MDWPLTLEEVKTELAIPGKSGRNRLSSSRGPLLNAKAEDRGLAEVRSELHNFHDNMKKKLEDMNAMLKLIEHEVQKQNMGSGVPPALSEMITI